MPEFWRSLRIGDKVRVMEWPTDLSEELMTADTRRFYRWLIDTKSVLEIVRIDEFGLPWGEIRRVVNGLKEVESVALNHGGLELAQGGRKSGGRKGGRREERGGEGDITDYDSSK